LLSSGHGQPCHPEQAFFVQLGIWALRFAPLG
jgi:hypothetical protein